MDPTYEKGNAIPVLLILGNFINYAVSMPCVLSQGKLINQSRLSFPWCIRGHGAIEIMPKCIGRNRSAGSQAGICNFNERVP
jgi:hypothetical protein